MVPATAVARPPDRANDVAVARIGAARTPAKPDTKLERRFFENADAPAWWPGLRHGAERMTMNDFEPQAKPRPAFVVDEGTIKNIRIANDSRGATMPGAHVPGSVARGA